jgi:hypothetical protein
MSKTIKLTSKQIEFLYKNSDEYGGFKEGGEELEGFEGWSISYDPDTGEYDSSKGAMVDFEIYLYGPDKNPVEDLELIGIANGGYYYQGDCSFNYDLEFHPPEPETPESLFRYFLMDIAGDNLSMDKMIKKIEKKIQKLRKNESL